MVPKRFADNTNERSAATRLRRQRFLILAEMLKGKPGPVRILDIGGTQEYWDRMMSGIRLDHGLQVTLLNLEAPAVSRPNFTSLAGDGRAMPQLVDRSFDVVFSNSTLEHVGSLSDQERMANEVRRIGTSYYIQTPNRYFPIEPHFLFPFFQFMPVPLRVWLVQRFSLGWHSRIRDRGAALREVRAIRLLSRKELRGLFPEASIFEERYLGLVKSFVAYTPAAA